MKRRTFLLTLSAAALPRVALADAVSDALAEITKARAGLKTLVGEFTQERKIGLLATAVKSTGVMTLVRPDRLRWELKPPDEITFWITPEGLAFATPKGSANAGKAAAGRFGAVLGDLMNFLGGDLDKLRARYDFTVKKGSDGMTLTAKPKAEEVAKIVKSIDISAGPELWTVKKVSIVEKSGDTSEITFTKLTRDTKVDAAKMVAPKS